MQFRTIIQRSLAYHWRSHVAVVLAVIAATASLTGALIVGDSMRESLRDLALKRLGPIDDALIAPRFFRAAIADEMSKDSEIAANFVGLSPAIVMQGGIQHANNKSRVNQINLYGVDERIARLGNTWPGVKEVAALTGRGLILNQALADDLNAKLGDDVLLRLEKRGNIAVETLLGRPDDTRTSLRVTVAEIVPTHGIGEFSPQPNQYTPRNAFIPLSILQRALDQQGRVNTILAVENERTKDKKSSSTPQSEADGLTSAFSTSAKLEDFDLNLRVDEKLNYIALETSRMLIEPPIEKYALESGRGAGLDARPVIAYLADTISQVDENGADIPGRQIPYSIVAALDPEDAQPGDSAIWLNEWAASDLGAKVGDKIGLDYDIAKRGGGLDRKRTTLTLERIVPLTGWAADPSLTPTYKGITDAKSLSDWNPPSTMQFDMHRIREKDEAYWRDHRATPKAFVSLKTGLKLWAENDDRFGRYTAIFFYPKPGHNLAESAASLRRLLLKDIYPADLGLKFQPVKTQALAASEGSTDFSQLFLAFSFFVIAAAAMLVALMFRLNVERRAREIGILAATGFAAKKVRRLFLGEGLALAMIGSALGLVGAVAYAALMITGLRTWWSAAVNAPFLALHVNVTSLFIGFVASILTAMLSIAWSLRGLTKMSPRALLANTVSSGRIIAKPGHRRLTWITLLVMLGVAAGCIFGSAISDKMPRIAAFFSGGAALLIAGLTGFSLWLSRDRHALIQAHGSPAMVQLAMRNMTRRRGRSLLTSGLIASAAFVVVAVGAFRHGSDIDATSKNSGTGGYALMAESTVPLPYDLSTPSGRQSLSLGAETNTLLQGATVTSLRLRDGDNSSCLNLYQVKQPRILGAPKAMIERGGFAFAKSLAQSPEEKNNSWKLLEQNFPDGAIPTIGDANSLTYLLKLGLGDDFTITDERGKTRQLRIVAMLSGSIFQGELLIADKQFGDLFPSISGYGFTLIDAPPTAVASLRTALENDLSDYSLDVQTTIERLNDYFAVENTYISTFQTLGGLGLILGTFGLAAVMLRNVLERRSELALLQAVGLRRGSLGWMVMTENAALLLAGLLVGTVAAAVAIAPSAAENASQFPWASLSITLLSVVVVGLAAGVAALRAMLRMPLVASLRSE